MIVGVLTILSSLIVWLTGGRMVSPGAHTMSRADRRKHARLRADLSRVLPRCRVVDARGVQ